MMHHRNTESDLENEMIWAKRRFQWADYAPYQDRLEKLLMANPTRYREFMMFSVEASGGEGDVYVGVPTKEFIALFDGFEPVREAALPKVVDALLIADANAFKERFEFRHNKTEHSR
jgi:hypothetical protein